MKYFFRKIGALSLLVLLIVLFAPTRAEAAGVCVGGRGADAVNQRVESVAQCNAIGRGLGFATTFIPDRAPGETATSTPAEAVGGGANGGTTILDLVNIPAQWIAGAVGAIAVMLLQVTSLFVYLSGLILNAVIQYTVVDMTKNLTSTGSVIDSGWRFVRDLGNMCFIFILLFAAIKTIIGQEKGTQRLIVKMVVVGILVNFSLFFTKFIIDISNILAMTFYDAIAPNALNSNASFGLSNSLMAPLKLQTIWQTSGFSGTNLLTIGVMGVIFTLITSFVFLAISVMFVVRFVVLIFVLILSPIAFFSFVLPNTSDLSKRWWDALTGQAFFAPIYFILTWIVVNFGRKMEIPGASNSIADAVIGATEAGVNSANPGAIGIFVNFAIMIALLIASLTIAKQFSGRSGVGKITGWATEKAGGALFGGSAFLGRQSFGRLGNLVANRTGLQEMAAIKEPRSGSERIAAAMARGTLGLARTARSARFDVRNASVPTNTLAAIVEGTAGRTRFGRAIGLDEATRHIPNIPVAATAQSYSGVNVGKPGEEGFKEEQASKAKRLEAVKKVSDDEYRKVKAKAVVDEGLKATEDPARPRTPAEEASIVQMQKAIKDMSGKEITALDKNTLSNEKVAEALTASHLKAIEEDKEGKFSEEDKREIFDQHFADVAEAVGALATNINPATGVAFANDAEKKPYQNRVRNISDKELEYIPASIFDPNQIKVAGPAGDNSRMFLKTLTQPQVDSLIKTGKLISQEVQAVKAERSRALEEAFGLITGVAANYAEAIKIMGNMRPEALVQLDDDKLTKPEVLELYRPALLVKMAARPELTEAKAKKIRDAIISEVNRTGATPSQELFDTADWLQSDGLKIF